MHVPVHAQICMQLCVSPRGESNFRVKGILVRQWVMSVMSHFSLSSWVWSISLRAWPLFAWSATPPRCVCCHSAWSQQIDDFSVSSLHLVQRAVLSLWFCYVRHAMMFRSMSILCIHLYHCYQWLWRIKKIQNKKIFRPTESSFRGLRDRKQGLFCIGLSEVLQHVILAKKPYDRRLRGAAPVLYFILVRKPHKYTRYSCSETSFLCASYFLNFFISSGLHKVAFDPHPSLPRDHDRFVWVPALRLC